MSASSYDSVLYLLQKKQLKRSSRAADRQIRIYEPESGAALASGCKTRKSKAQSSHSLLLLTGVTMIVPLFFDWDC